MADLTGIGATGEAFARRWAFAVGRVLVTLAAVALVVTPSAVADTPLDRVGAFNEALPDGQPAHQHRIAVNEASGDVYVVDTVYDQITVYRPSGGSANWLTMFGSGVLTDPFGIAIDQETGDVYVSDDDAVVKFNSDGAAIPTFTQDAMFTSPAVTGPLAFDQSSDLLLVADRASDTVRRYNTAGGPGPSFDGSAGVGSPGAFVGLQDLAVDSTGDIVVVDATGNPAHGDGSVSRVERFGANGDWKATIGPVEQAATVTIGPEADEVLVSGDQNRVYSFGTPSVHRFAADGTLLGQLEMDSSVLYATVSGMAADGNAERVYVATDNADYGNGFDQYSYGYTSIQVYGNRTLPVVTTGGTSAVTGASATLEGEVNPDGVDATYYFEWGLDNTYGNVTPESDPLSGSSAQPVSAAITGLSPGTTYHYRLVAANSNGVVPGEDAAFTTNSIAPEIVSTSAEPIYTGADLRAAINPGGGATTYRFEYGSTDSYGRETVQKTIPAGIDPVRVVASIDELEPGTEYHFRVVASNESGSLESSDATFTTLARPSEDDCPNAAIRAEQGAAHVPDCRAWEQASPVDKNGGDAGSTLSYVSPTMVSANGNAVAYTSNDAFGNPEHNSGEVYVAEREQDGWSTINLGPPVRSTGLYNGVSLTHLTADFSKSLVATATPLTNDPPAGGNIYVRNYATGTYSLVTRYSAASPSAIPPLAVGASSAFDHVLAVSRQGLTPDAPATTAQLLYEWVAGEPDQLRLAGRLPDGSLDPDGAALGGQSELNVGSVHNAVSEDGSRVFFNSPAGANNVYLSEDGQPGTQISSNGKFWSATPNGSRVLLTTGNLTVNGGLQRYDVETATATDLAPDDEPADGDNPGVVGVVGASDDLSRVYFVARGRLTPGEGATGEYNLYLSEDGAVTFIGVLALDAPLFTDRLFPVGSQRAVSPDGSKLAFATGARLTEFDSAGGRELYVYDATSHELTCPTCMGDAGVSGLGANDGGRIASFPMWQRDQQNFSADGSRLFFQSDKALVPEDSNGTHDVYEWTVDGDVRLISHGTGETGALLIGASSTGENVYFNTRDQLVGQDRDYGYDVYDARVGGGLVSQRGAEESAPCSGESCRGAVAGRPELPIAGSIALAGHGNAGGGRSASWRVSLSRLKAIVGSVAVLRVRTPSGGRLRLSGKGLRSVSRRLRGGGLHRVRVVLSRKASRSLRKRNGYVSVARVRFTSADGSDSVARIRLKFKKRSTPARGGRR